MKKLSLIIVSLLVIAPFCHCQAQKQTLILVLKSDKQAYSIDEQISFMLSVNNLSSEKIKILAPSEGLKFNFIVILDDKEYKNCAPMAWGGSDSLFPESKMNIAIELRECGISKDILPSGKHHIAIKLNKAISNTITFKVIEQRKATSDPIDRLVERLSETHGLWINGAFPAIGLPSTATTEQVTSKVFQMVGFAQGHVTHHKIQRVKKVRIPFGFSSEQYEAVLVETDLGEKILLLQYQTSGWWSRVYDKEQ